MARLRELGLVECSALAEPARARRLPRHAAAVRRIRRRAIPNALGLIPGAVRQFTATSGSARAAHGLEPADGHAEPITCWPGMGDDDTGVLRAQLRGAGRRAGTLATSDYGGAFSAVVARGNFRGMQFHPERSRRGRRAAAAEFPRIMTFDADPGHRSARRPGGAPEAGRLRAADDVCRRSARAGPASCRCRRALAALVDLDGARSGTARQPRRDRGRSPPTASQMQAGGGVRERRRSAPPVRRRCTACSARQRGDPRAGTCRRLAGQIR